MVLENSYGEFEGIEVKASSTIRGSDFKGLKKLRRTLADQFVKGIVLYIGSRTISLDTDLTAAPIAALWV